MYAYEKNKTDFSGGFITRMNVLPPNDGDLLPWAYGEREARKVWALCEELVEQKFEF
jgi:hypothetical protein